MKNGNIKKYADAVNLQVAAEDFLPNRSQSNGVFIERLAASHGSLPCRYLLDIL